MVTVPVVRPSKTAEEIAKRTAPPPAPVAVPPAPPIRAPSFDDLESVPEPPKTFFGTSQEAVNHQFIQRLDTPIGETIETTFDAAVDRQSMAVTGALKDQYDLEIEALEKATGQRLFNPYSQGGFGRREFGRRQRAGEDLDGVSQTDVGIELFHRQAAALRKQFPELAFRSHDQIIAKVQADRAEVRKRRAAAAAGEHGILSTGAAFIGTAGGALLDPINLTTLPLGAPWAAGILRAIGTEAAIAVGSETVIQGIFQTSRSQVGEEADLGEALGDIAAAGIGAGVLGGAIRGVAKGVSALKTRRANLERAEALPAEQRTPDIEAAIQVERRALEIDEANPYGRDADGAAIHADRFNAATRALAEDRVTPRSDPDTPAPVLMPNDAQVIREFVDLARDPEGFAARIQVIRDIPEEALQQAETLAEFVRREGGFSKAEAEAAGIRADDFPALFKNDGQPIDALATRAEQEGFFPAGRPEPQDLIQAVADEVTAGRAVRRPSPDADGPKSEVIQAADQAAALRRAGVDLDALTPSEAAARVRTLGERIAQGQRNATAAVGQPLTNSAPDGGRGAQARIEAAETSTAAERADELDAIREQQVRDAFADDPNAKITIEEEDGTIRSITARELFEQAEKEADEIEALRLCIAGGTRRST